ncbi:MAG: TetR/AcrR family transcriptional regulator [Candidatus Binataceae bacterium]
MAEIETSAVTVELRSQDSREVILRAASKLFAIRGFHETSMAEVARAAKVSKALIFWHFKTKEELFLAVLGQLLEPYVLDFAEESAALDEKAQILKLLESYLLFVRDNASSIRFFVAQLLHDEKMSEGLSAQVLALYEAYRTLLADLVSRVREKDLCTQHVARVSPRMAVAFILSTLNGLLVNYLFLGNQGLDLEGAREMLGQWLFSDSA